ncbi:MAG TPA: 2-isopropylmalate synthase [Termitinemataceae bacterium]|uniref:2-isopropylmalate synthase n=1 Tax=Treponema sp. J25 TaxID=2094121 RepID=UPI00104718F1|nr:2-isopropylmalate synthase [Treponema sp. J25]TCW60917.1 2-isopropylmalate synthase [Treponema sp. J25]HOJ99902.1 2-isopropylmalate synthase [Termitinemataceae bacterium]HOM24142.1 2-isopropylmalate synthase [Termitinemataceae bacterium]HPQ01209.1 2-isopropylmalate synthase [Termitinemataceae bacterium]
MARTIQIFDTTLRDGEQAPGCSMNLQEKVEVARQLEKLGVDVMEAGFPAASPGDLAAVKAVAGVVKNSVVAGLCRALDKDIDAGWEALAKAAAPRIHTFIATSPIHMEYKLKMSPDQVLERAVAAVRYAKRYCSDVEFSAEDASRSDPDFLCKVFAAVIDAGATVVNIPDTVGYAIPEEFGRLVQYVKEHTPNIDRVKVSVHCHNDLGLAVANSLAALVHGADQVECTINGLGERAGNASLEEIVMALRTRKDLFDLTCRVDTTQIYATSRLVSQVTGVRVQPNKAIVGENAFAHEAGIHQHGVLANRATYEIMTPESIGIPRNRMVLGKHSGRHAFEERIKDLGFTLEPQAIEEAFQQFKILADKKKVVSDRDIEALIAGTTATVPETYRLDRWVVNSGSTMSATSTIRLAHKDGTIHEYAAVGDGPIDAAFKAIDHIIGKEPDLEAFELGAVTGGEDAQGEATVKIAYEGRRWNGRGISTDIIEAAIKAYIAAINAMEWELAAVANGNGTKREVSQGV